MNFPTADEEAYAAQQEMLDARAVEKDHAVALKAKAQGFRSAFVGVAWNKRDQQWRVNISHNGESHYLGQFDDKQEAARAYDTDGSAAAAAERRGPRWAIWQRSIATSALSDG